MAPLSKRTALDVFTVLEGALDTELEGDPPVYDVRLDAKTSEHERYYTVRVSAARGRGGFSPDDLLYVLEVARDQAITTVDIDNSAIVLG